MLTKKNTAKLRNEIFVFYQRFFVKKFCSLTESSAYDKALESDDNKTQNKLLKIAFDRANKKGWKIVED